MSLTKCVNGVHVPMTPEEEAALLAEQAAWDACSVDREAIATRLAADAGDISSCKFDSQIMSLVNQTRDQWLTWASNNFPTLTAPEKTRLGNLFWVVAIGVRRAVR